MKTYPQLKQAVPLDDFRLVLVFDSDEKREYDFKPNLSHKYFSPLADIRLLKSVEVVDGETEWATGQDFCPNTLYGNSTPLL